MFKANVRLNKGKYAIIKHSKKPCRNGNSKQGNIF